MCALCSIFTQCTYFQRLHKKLYRVLQTLSRLSACRHGLRLRERNATMTSKKCLYHSGCMCKNECEMTFAWVQKAASGSVCKVWHYCNHSVKSQKP